jgi:hemoglobin
MSMKEIQTREDIVLLVDTFYKQVLEDELIGFFFSKIAALDLQKHMPTMYDFWESALLGNMVYQGNPMVKHLSLNQKSALKAEHFERWLELWEKTLTENFTGKKADDALLRAKQISGLIQFKIHQTSQ